MFRDAVDTAQKMKNTVIQVANSTIQAGLNFTNSFMKNSGFSPITDLVDKTKASIFGGVVSNLGGTVSANIKNPSLIGGLIDTVNSVQTVTNSLNNVQKLVVDLGIATLGDFTVTVDISGVPRLTEALRSVAAGAQIVAGNLNQVVVFFNQTFDLVQDTINRAGANVIASIGANASSKCQLAARAAANDLVNRTTANTRLCFQNELNTVQSDLQAINQILTNVQNFATTGQVKLSYILYAVATSSKISTDMTGIQARISTCASLAVAKEALDVTDVTSKLAFTCVTKLF